MKVTRKAAAGMLLILTLMMAMLAACGSRPSKPGATATPSVPPSASLTPSATPAPGPATPSGSPAPSTQVVSSRVAYSWHWPNDVARPGQVAHAHQVPPVPQLVRISVGNHPGDQGGQPFNRMSFTFTTAFPSYRFAFVPRLVGDASGKVIPLRGLSVLKIVFTGAQAHSADGKRSTIISQPAPGIGYPRMTSYAQGGDFEGVLTYGIGVSWPIPQSNPQLAVRAYELETVTGTGQHQYVVAIDIDASNG